MSLLDDLSQSSIGSLLGSYGPSLLTQPQMPSQPNDVAPSSGQPLGQPSPLAGMEPTLAQQLAQRAPTHPGGLAGFFGKALDALVPIPDAYKQMMSPADIKRLQMQGLQQIGAGLTGAYTGPNQRKDFGVDLGMGLNAARANTSTALDPLQEMLKTQTQGVGLESLMQRQQMLQQLGGLAQAPVGETHAQAAARYGQLAARYSAAGLTAEAGNYARLQANEQRAADQEGGSAPAKSITTTQWGGYVLPHDPNTGMVKAPIDGAQFKKGDWVSPEQLGQAPQTREQALTETDKQVNTFNSDTRNKQYLVNADTGNKLLQAIQMARQGNTQVNQTIPVLLAKLVHEGSVGRLGLMKQIGPIDESLVGRFNAMVAKAGTGNLPPDQLNTLEQSVRALVNDSRQQYTTRYQKATRTLGQDAYRVMSPDEAFGPSTAAPQLNLNATYNPKP